MMGAVAWSRAERQKAADLIQGLLAANLIETHLTRSRRTAASGSKAVIIEPEWWAEALAPALVWTSTRTPEVGEWASKPVEDQAEADQQASSLRTIEERGESDHAI